MPGTQPRAPIHTRPWRTTEVEGTGADAVFVKRFHDARWPGAWAGRWRDRLRARREARRLEALARSGIAVPGVLGVREGEAGVELRTRWIPGARPLADLLGTPGCERLARPLGQLLAGLHAAGWSHGDLHAGNVVVDAAGRPWLIDARALRRFRSTHASADVLSAVAAVRERTTSGFRARLLCAYLGGLPESLRASGAALRRGIDALEDLAREARARGVDREIDRWLRDSGACAVEVVDGREVLFARCADRAEARELVRRALSGGAPAGASVLRGREDVVTGAWLAAATAREHALAGPEPIALVRGSETSAVLRSLPGSCAPQACSDLAPARRRRIARGLGALAGALFDRLLALERADVLVRAAGDASIAPGAVLLRTASLSAAIRPFAGIAASPVERAAFAAAFARALRGTRGEQRRVRAELTRG